MKDCFDCRHFDRKKSKCLKLNHYINNGYQMRALMMGCGMFDVEIKFKEKT